MSLSRTCKRKRTESYGLGDFMTSCDVRPQPGDLVEIDRTLYSHWALCVGNGQAIHVQGLNKNQIDIPLSGSATVKLGRIIDVCGKSPVRVNNKDVPAKERGLKAFAADKVISATKKLVGKTVNYNLLTRNCEHFVTEWKYGKAWSDQAFEDLLCTLYIRADLYFRPEVFIYRAVSSDLYVTHRY
ncbi:Retinoic acid receptor responder protein 3 [Nymphon striatum]|nr:Retinoic acid receptor responder protein 3 [Nymphon striatum]